MIRLICKIYPYLILIIIIIFLFGNTLIPTAAKIIYGGDILQQFYFWKGYLAQSIRSGFIPFWNPYVFSGTPYLAHPSTAFFYPPTVLFIIFPLNLAFSLYLSLHFFIAGTGMFRLLKTYAKGPAAIAGTLIFICGGVLSSRIYAGHVDILSTIAWIPWVLYAMRMVIFSPKKNYLILAVIMLSMEILAGFTSIVVFTLEMVFIYTLIYSLKSGRGMGLFLKMLTIIVLAAGLSAIQWLPTMEFIRHSVRGNGLPYDLAVWGSLPLSGMKLFVNPFDTKELSRLPFSFAGFVLPDFFEYFMGKTVIFTIIIFQTLIVIHRFYRRIYSNSKNEWIPVFTGMTSKIRLIIHKLIDLNNVSFDFWIYLTICIFFIWLSLGNQVKISLYDIFYNFIPFYRNFRIPAQHLIMVAVLLPVLFTLVVGILKNKYMKTLVMIIAVVEMIFYSRQFFILTDIPVANPGLVKIFQSDHSLYRVMPVYDVVSPVLKSLELNMPMVYGIQTTAGYDPMILSGYYDYVDHTVNRTPGSSLLYRNVEIPVPDISSPEIDILNVKYLILNKQSSIYLNSVHQLQYKKVADGGDWDVYENTDYESRFYLQNDCGTGKIIVDDYRVNRIDLMSETSCDNKLLTSEIYYPGWKAKVDGLDTKVQMSKSVYRTLDIPKGSHKIVMYYSPQIYLVSAIISVLSLAGLFYIPKKIHE